MTTEDRRNINLTADAARVAAELKERFGFPELLDVVRLGFAYALAQGIAPDPLLEGAARGANYNSATIDGDERLLSALVISLANREGQVRAPYQTIEVLMNRGIMKIEEDLRTGRAVSIADLLRLAQDLAEIESATSK
jgi:hypothetical protein